MAYEDFSTSEEEFLSRLAAPEWGARNAADMATVWQTLGNAYMQYPLGFEFQYYGPMHDGAVWPLHLKNVLRKLPRTWKPDYEPAGDAVGEFLNNFDLPEMTVLCRKLSEAWDEGWQKLQTFINHFKGDKAREMDAMLIEALNCHFLAGADIVEFYFLRNRMLNNAGSTDETLKMLEDITKRQISISDRLAELCEADPRLGYHSEAEVYKYFPEKLRWRSETLRQLLADGFPALRNALAEGQSCSEVLEEKAEFQCGITYRSESFTWQASREERCLRLDITIKDAQDKYLDDVMMIMIGDRLAAMRPWNIVAAMTPSQFISDGGFRNCCKSKFEKQSGFWKAEILIPLALLPDADCCRIGFERSSCTREGVREYEHFPKGEYDHDGRLQFGSYTPDMMKKLLF